MACSTLTLTLNLNLNLNLYSSMPSIHLTVNGIPVTAEAGKTILEIVRAHNLDSIPTLCHDPKLEPYASCFLCVVEVEGVPRLLPSCAIPAAEGMVVHTRSARIEEARRTALALLLSNHYADCVAPCRQTCPAGVDVQGYVALAAAGKYHEAVRLIRETNPLPLVCGRVCVRECEVACRRNRVDEPVGIDFIKRYATDYGIRDDWKPAIAPAKGKRVAVIGGGPSGLTCGYYLLRAGYGVTIFEKMEKLGGMLRYGIPSYRLPRSLLDREIDWITGLGIEVRTGKALGRDFTLEGLLKEGFDALYIALGAQKAKCMDIPDEAATEGIFGGVDFLREVEEGRMKRLPGRVIVVGGGNTALDAARTSLRLGAEHVTILYRRTRKEMPAHPAEIDAAADEGVEMRFLSAPERIVEEGGKLFALTCLRMELGEPDASGRRRPVPIEGSEYDLPCEYVISAIGQDTELAGIAESGIGVNRWGTIKADPETMQTSVPNIFAGGDVVSGPAVVIEAVAMGRKAAVSIDESLTTGAVPRRKTEFIRRKEYWGEPPESEFSRLPKIERERMRELPPAKRIRTFDEVECGFTGEQARRESLRCLSCGCAAYFTCALRSYAEEYGVDIGRYAGAVARREPDARHPLIALDPNKCILCGRCVRTCREILGIAALGFVYRGFHAVVKPAMEKPLAETNCIACGNCIDACPTGAIVEKLPFPKPGPWAPAPHPSVCVSCSVGCRLEYRVFHEGLFAAACAGAETHNRGYLCGKGRFGYSSMMDPARILHPMLRREGTPVRASWKEAYAEIGKGLGAVVRRHGPGSVALFGSPRMTNEELFLLRELANGAFESEAAGSFTAMLGAPESDALDPLFGATVSTATFEDLRDADLILVVNADPMEEHLVAGLHIKAAMKKGAKLIAFGSAPNGTTRLADVWIDGRRGSTTAILLSIINELIRRGAIDRKYIERRTSGFDAFAASIAYWDAGLAAELSGARAGAIARAIELFASSGPKVVFLYDVDEPREKSKEDLRALGDLLLTAGRAGRSGSGIILLRDFANSQGLLDLGLEGTRSLNGAPPIKRLLEEGGIKGAVVFGEDPCASPGGNRLLAGVEYLVAIDTTFTATARSAAAFLPMALPVETGGSYTSCDRRVQQVAKLFEPLTGRDNREIIADLARILGAPPPVPPEGIRHAIAAKHPRYAAVDREGHWGGTLYAERFATPEGLGRFLPCAVDLAPLPGNRARFLNPENHLILRAGNRPHIV